MLKWTCDKPIRWIANKYTEINSRPEQAFSFERSNEYLMSSAYGTRNPDGGYPADFRDVMDGIGKVRKAYN